MDININNSKQKNQLKSKSQKLKPVVIIGIKGLTTEVIKEIDVALSAHNIIKIRFLEKNKNTYKIIISEICNHLSCSHVYSIGNIVILYRKPKIS
ncbi:RNA-binding protein [Candidatus Kinetoplastibacterium sorsogonicusi]|uniref:RNA-binding protein n=1 Tax=Candidatus Kinetoplastidibacterium kentomonadis TaxID=1576550 RepID=A0A3Q8ER35_9PROT|nr:YhbY family RNA-binding protein [Candidatus Kinetoplastibacterium sorsogonicusi]AWD32281.1 RNA-binding protein [Candidatus Kinetoplastibacterium sorsogonicusi]